MVLSLYNPPSVEPVTLTEVKINLGYAVSAISAAAFTARDDELTRRIKTAREYVENICNRSLITQTWDLYINDWPDCREVVLPKGKIQSITTFEYTDTDGATTDFEEYTLDSVSVHGKAVLNYQQSWPSVELTPVNPIHIRFVSGFGDTSASVPSSIKDAMHLIIAHWDKNKEPVVVRTTTANVSLLPMAIDTLLADYRLPGFA